MEPCGGLPITTLHVRLTWCHHHQAWSAGVERVDQDGDDALLTAVATMGFGPFDRIADVAAWLRTSLDAMETPPGVPWW